jgi:hypothetical protein
MMTTRKKTAVFLCLWAALVLPFASGQENSKAVDKLVRDQKMIRMRLQRIEEVMDRLVRKYESEGGRRNADLILKARRELKQRDVYGRLEELEQLLREGRLQIVEKQTSLSRDLEDVFAILQDRNDLERLEDVLNALADGMITTGELIREEEQLLKETRRINHDPATLIAEALEKVRDLIAAQEDLASKTEEASRKAGEAAELLVLAAELEALAEREETIEARAGEAVRERAGDAVAALGETARNQESLAERLGNAAAEAREGRASHDRGAFMRRQIALGEALREAADELASGNLPEEVKKMLDEASGGMARAEKALDERRWDEAAKEARAAATKAVEAEEELGRGGDGRIGPDQEEIGRDLSRAIESMEKVAGGKAGEEAVARARAAAREAAAAARSFGEGSDAAARRKAEAASRGMREAADALRRSWQESVGERKDETGDLADEQNASSRDARDVAEKLATASDLLEEENALDGERQAARDVADEMDRAEGQLRREAPGLAGEPQQNAAEGLKKLRDALEKKAGDDGLKSAGEMSPQEKSEKYQDLTARQKELEERTRDLMRRLRELPDQKALGSLSNAADNMDSASSELGNEQGGMAEQDEEDARKQLENALNEMKGEQQKYQDIQQQEILFRVQQELEVLKEEQDSITAATEEFDAGREGERSLRRSQKKLLRGLALREQDVLDRTQEVKEKIEEDGSTVFTWILERNRDDLDEIVGFLKGYSTDKLVRTIQKDVSNRFEELISALRQELKRRMESPPPGEGQKPGQGGPQPLIPPVAELIMMKTMEEGALRRLEEFMVTTPAGDDEEMLGVVRELIRRLANEHMAVTELFEEVLERSGGQHPPSGGQPPPDGE